MYIFYAILSCIFASLTSILAKLGLDSVNSTLATALRTVVVLVFSWIMVFVTNNQSGLKTISTRAWIYLLFSGLATGLSWLMYYKALFMGQVKKVASIDKFSIVLTILISVIFLGEKIDLKTILGLLFITVGTVFMIL